MLTHLRSGSAAACLLLVTTLFARPLSRSLSIDFFRDVPSRNLHGLAVREDGSLVSGPDIRAVPGAAPAGLLWSLAPVGDNLVLGTGPEGKIYSLAVEPGGAAKYTELLALPGSHVFAIQGLPDGSLLAGTSPEGNLVLARGGKVVARATLPVSSIFDLLVLPAVPGQSPVALVATGSPGRIYRVDLQRLAAAGVQPEAASDTGALVRHGITLFGAIRDDNVRCLALRADGRVVAGSAPSGNIYEFAAQGGAPLILMQNQQAEVSDLLPWPGGVYAAVTFSTEPESTPGPLKSQAGNPPPTPPPTGVKAPETPAPTLNEVTNPPRKFAGHAQLIWLPDHGFPETACARDHTAFYRLQTWQDKVLIAGGESGEILGYDPAQRLTLIFPGTASAQLNGFVPDPTQPGAFYLLGNNPPQLYRMAFPGGKDRSAETRRLDLGDPAEIGGLRFPYMDALPPASLVVEMRAGLSDDPLEGWSPWQKAAVQDGAWTVPGLRGRYIQMRLSHLPAGTELSPARLHYLPQDHRPVLNIFHILPPDYGLMPPPLPSSRTSITLGAYLQDNDSPGDPPGGNLLDGQLYPLPGSRVAVWQVTDADGDNVLCTFSIRHTGDEQWQDLAVDTREAFVQFDTTHLPEGVYHSRLLARETAPRPAADRLHAAYLTDDFIVDHTPPVILAAKAVRDGQQLLITVRARDALSLMGEADFTLNNGYSASVEQPDDGIRDGHEESFTLTVPLAQASGATSVEITVLDQPGNSAARRLPLAGLGVPSP